MPHFLKKGLAFTMVYVNEKEKRVRVKKKKSIPGS